MLIDDMAWCWWTRPRLVQVGDLLHTGAIDSRGQVVVATVDVGTGAVQRHVLARIEDDDHNNPAVVVEAGRPVVAFYSRHEVDDALRFRVSTRPDDISQWHPERVLTFGGETTYAQVHPRGCELHLFTRIAVTRWGYRRSPDWAATWEPARDLLAFDTDQEVYVATTLLADGTTVRLAVSGHPKEYNNRPEHNVFVCTIDLGTGAIALPSDGRVVANLDGTGLPLSQHDLELIHACPADRSVNLFDVGDGPDFEVGFVSKIKGDDATVDAQYHVTAMRAGEWSTETVCAAGTTFGYIPAGCYVGGVAFPHRSPGGQVFVAREAAGEWFLERWDRDGVTWQPHRLIGPSATRLARPWAVTGARPDDGGPDVVALSLERYGDSYFGTLSHLIGARV